jgi:hypothetical protein
VRGEDRPHQGKRLHVIMSLNDRGLYRAFYEKLLKRGIKGSLEARDDDLASLSALTYPSDFLSRPPFIVR